MWAERMFWNPLGLNPRQKAKEATPSDILILYILGQCRNLHFKKHLRSLLEILKQKLWDTFTTPEIFLHPVQRALHPDQMPKPTTYLLLNLTLTDIYYSFHTKSEAVLVDIKRGMYYPLSNVLYPLPAMSNSPSPLIKVLPLLRAQVPPLPWRLSLSFQSIVMPLPSKLTEFLFSLYRYSYDIYHTYLFVYFLWSFMYISVLPAKLSSWMQKMSFWTFMAQKKITPLELRNKTNQVTSICWFCPPGIHPPRSGNSVIILHSFSIHAQIPGLRSGHVTKV